MRYDDRIIDQVQTANDIVDIIGQVLPLKRAGRNLKACCPFHSEKSPSFMVNPEKQIFHCFGCGTGGNVFTFLMKYENSSFPETLRKLAERAHIVLPEPAGGANRESRSESEKLYEIYEQAVEFYHGQFLDPVKGKAARDYFYKRGYTEETATEMKMGWCTDSWRSLLEFLVKKNYDETLLLKSGLITRSPAKGTLYDSFRSRLLFPIRNLQGKYVAFGGRLIADIPGPKYLNSSENPVFHKRRELFGLHVAKKFVDRDNPRLLVVEGYFDFLRLFQAGFKTTVATLGTSLTPEHVQILKRFAGEAVVVYDGDKAGEAASMRGLEVFLEGGMSVRVARLPAGLDPDDFVEKQGNEAFQKIIDEARDFFDFKYEVLSRRHNIRESAGLMRVTNEFLDTFSKIENPVLLDRYLKKLSVLLGVEENSLRSELAKLRKKTTGLGTSPKTFPDPVVPKPKAPTAARMSEEILLLALAVEDTRFRDALFEGAGEEDFREAGSKELFRLLQPYFQEGQKIQLSQVLSRLSDEQYKQKLIAASSMEWNDEGREKAFSDCLRKVQKNRIGKRLEELRRSIAIAEQEGNPGKVDEYAKEYQALWREYK